MNLCLRHLTHTKKIIKDDKGGEVVVARIINGPDDGKILAEFQDANTRFSVESTVAGFNNRKRSGSIDRAYLSRSSKREPYGVIECSKNDFSDWKMLSFWRNDITTTRRNSGLVENAAWQKIADYAAEHPQIGEQLRALTEPLTTLRGKPATFADFEKNPPTFARACPTNKPNVILETR